MATDVEVPALGESITEGTLAEWLKKPGEAVAADEPIASLETDKVSVEVPSPVAGVLTEQLVQEGDNVAVGAVIARVDQNAAAGAAAPATPAQSAAASTTNPAGAGETPALRGDAAAPDPEAANAETSSADDHITTLSPAVRRAVLEYHVDPTSIRGTGKDGRLTKDDVIAAAQVQRSSPAQAGAQAEAKLPSAAQQQPSAPGARPSPGDRKEERVKMSRLRQTIAKRLKEAQNTAAMLTTFNDVDMSAVMEARSRYKDLFEKKHGIRLGFMSFFVKACALAARDGQVVIRPMMYIALTYDHRLVDGREAVTALKIIKEAIEDPMRMLIDL